MSKIQSIGTIWKREKLATLEWEVSFSELLLEAKDPWPGYYDHFEIPSQEADLLPRWIFAIVKSTGPLDHDNIIYITSNIKQETGLSFDAVPGRIVLNNEEVPCIRFNIDEYKILSELLAQYRKSGIEFAAHRKVAEYESLIKITKYFDLAQLTDFIYQDNDLADTYYVPLPNRVNWSEFEAITKTVKNNSDHKIFDAALGATYTKKGMNYMVRIYDRETDADILNHLCIKYRNEAARYA
jgi:hypothetical protein